MIAWQPAGFTLRSWYDVQENGQQKQATKTSNLFSNIAAK